MRYKGYANDGFGGPVAYIDGATHTPLPPRNDLYDHSPDGFNWGYPGSGPGQLALALCAHCLGMQMPQDDADNLAMMVYQKVKWHTSCVFPKGKEWVMTAFTVNTLIHKFLKAGTGIGGQQ